MDVRREGMKKGVRAITMRENSHGNHRPFQRMTLTISSLPYGHRTRELELPANLKVEVVRPRTPPPHDDPDELIRSCLGRPIGSPPLREIARGKQSAAILIPGKARRVGTRRYVPALIDELRRGGISAQRIEIVLADGTHVQHVESDIRDLLGNELTSTSTHWGHDCRDEQGLQELGQTRYGTPVAFNRRVLEADVKVLTGRIVPHYFAGYSGGRKALLPGVAGFRTILANHRLTLDPKKGIHPRAKICVLEGNPIHEDMVEAARMARPDFCFNTLLDAQHGWVGAVCGDVEAAHHEGCLLADQWYHLRQAEPYDVVISSAGGLPYDCNFMQALKAAFNICDLLTPGGLLLWVAQCAGGIHPGFVNWAEHIDDARLEDAIRQNYALTGHNSLMLRQLIRRAQVALCSDLPAETVRTLGLHAVNSMVEGVDWLRQRLPRGGRCAVVPHANVIACTLD